MGIMLGNLSLKQIEERTGIIVSDDDREELNGMRQEKAKNIAPGKWHCFDLPFMIDEDFENAYAQIEPLSEDKGEIFDRFKTVDRVFSDLGIHCAYDMPSFWCNKGKDYAVIETKYHKGYMQALKDVEKEVRLRFGFSERDNLISMPFDGFFKAEEGE